MPRPGWGGSGQFSRPQWASDGQSIFYGRTVAVGEYDIYRTPADGSSPIGTPVVTGTTNDYQPALSADGTKLCFTRQGATGKDIYIVPSAGGTASPLLVADGTDEYECAWSPDGAKIAFVRGAFGNGEILMKNSDASRGLDPVTNVAGRFDGNPELRITTGPSNGTLSGINEDDNSVIYTPNADFRGTDSFTYAANDQTTESAPATVTVTVDETTPKITDVSVFPRRWRRGSKLPRLSARVGTRIRWRLSEAANVTLTFQRARPGRRVGARCLPPTPARRARPRCTRFIRAGRLSFPNAKAGLNTVRFQGRLSARRRLALGVYRVVVGAVDPAGNRSKSRRSRTFRIVAR